MAKSKKGFCPILLRQYNNLIGISYSYCLYILFTLIQL